MGKKGFFSHAKRKRELAKQEKKKKKAERREQRKLDNDEGAEGEAGAPAPDWLAEEE